VLADFRAGRLEILLATNVAARGLDVHGVGRVINYELPESPEWFTHRVGRTGRMGQKGEAITLLTPEDAAKWRQFEKALDKRFPRRRWPDGAPILEPAGRTGQPRLRADFAQTQPSARTASQPRQSTGHAAETEPSRFPVRRRRRFSGRAAARTADRSLS
jgi:ATP-dependent RNA helicase DeaD